MKHLLIAGISSHLQSMELSAIEILGYVASMAIGVALGLIGGGGSILTVPVLVYLFAVEPVLATAYSLFIVGITAAAGSVQYFRKGLVHTRTALVFGIPSIAAVFSTRAFIIPAIPDEVFSIGEQELTKGTLMMVLFAILMIAASWSMIRKSAAPAERKDQQEQSFNYALILTEGLVVGVLTGLVGAGGGFLIVPALVILSKLPMKQAVGTSLVIIALKSLIGFLGEGHGTFIDWRLLLCVSAFAMAGLFAGMAWSRRVDGTRLKPAFGWFTLVMGILMILKETLFS